MGRSFVIEVEQCGVRTLYGPMDDNKEIGQVAAHFRDKSEKLMVRELVSPSSIIPDISHIHPDQTTVDEQIEQTKHAEDYVDPATVG